MPPTTLQRMAERRVRTAKKNGYTVGSEDRQLANDTSNDLDEDTVAGQESVLNSYVA